MTILDLFCSVDEFWQSFAPAWERESLVAERRQRRRATSLHPREIMTIMILFQQSGYRTFKAFFTRRSSRSTCWSTCGLSSLASSATRASSNCCRVCSCR